MFDRPNAPAYALAMSEHERERYRRMARMAQENERALWERAGIVVGALVADIGCGPGAMLRVVADVVGPAGAAHGVEPDPEARAAAVEEIAGLPHARVTEGHGQASGLERDHYDAVMLRHVLFHTGDRPAAILEHVAGLLKPGGRCYLVDVDLDAMRIVPSDPGVTEEHSCYVDYQRGRGNDVRIGSRLGHLVTGAGLIDVHRQAWFQVVPGALFAGGGPPRAACPQLIAAGAATVEDGERWDAARAQWSATPDAVAFIPVFVAIGTRPA